MVDNKKGKSVNLFEDVKLGWIVEKNGKSKKRKVKNRK